MKTVYGTKTSAYSIVADEDSKGHYMAYLYRGNTCIYSDAKPRKSLEIACRKVIDNYIKEGFEEYRKCNSLVDEFMGEPQTKRNYWNEYRAKIKANELEELKKIAERGY